MARYFFIAAFFAAIFISPALGAADYKPGTVGYLYEDCRKALADSASLGALQASVCGAFTEGYFWGVSSADWAVLTSSPDGPCGQERQQEYERINNRGCGALPRLNPETESAGVILGTATDILVRWVDFEKKNGRSDPLNRPAVKALNGIITPGPFCDDLAKSYPAQGLPFSINAALRTMTMRDFAEARKNLSLGAKHEQCRKDVAAAGGDPAKFMGTRCGAEISGYIAGLHSTKHLQKNRPPPSKACKKEIDRLYRSLNVTDGMCVTYQTSPLKVAALFLANYGGAIRPGADGTGGIGYQVINKGLLCAKKK